MVTDVRMNMLLRRMDIATATVFVLLSVLSYAFGFFFILEHKNNPKLIRLNMTVIVYGFVQSLIGYITGYCFARFCWAAAMDTIASYSQLTQQEEEVAFV